MQPKKRTVDDLDGGTFEVPDEPVIPADGAETMELTRRMIAFTEIILWSLRHPHGRAQSDFKKRVLRINEYLCKRYNR